MLGLLIAITSCTSALLLSKTASTAGRTFGLALSGLWLFAGVSAGTSSVAKVAAFCAVCFALPLLVSALRRLHV
ncbi:hypothetical protein C3Y08_25120 [Burkholderia gladioli]|uniref:hypothetical protein n=1 Tax=Burkholderia gladioli TaxID=28095 RepID=UPI000CDADD0B|nr:hypothetical protein [Burkholderia gladioli]POS05305.1 hypothetical protein C3Y08_25120 [Burkholderia gladioli]